MLSAKRDVEILQRRFQQLDNSISESFARLKKDLAKQAAEVESLKSIIKKHEDLIAELQKNGKSGQEAKPKHPPAILSPLHYDILKCLMILQMESKRRTISLRELAAELYPNKAYNTIKTTLSRYIDELHRNGLVEKIRRYRLYISYTEKALSYADNERLSRMKDLIS
jgi:DUF438 domain-containing protein